MIRAIQTKALLFALLVIATLQAHSQGWVKKYSPDKMMGISSLYTTPDGGFLTTGWNLAGYEQRIMKIDANGTPVWVTEQDSFSFTSFSNITTDGGLISLRYGKGNDRILLRTDANGQELWRKEVYPHVPYGNGVGNGDADTTDNGGFICSFSVFDTTVKMHRLFVLRTDGNGDSLWRRTYFENDTLVYIHSIRNSGDGGFTLVSAHSSTQQPAYRFSKIDGNGNLLWSNPLTDYVTQTPAGNGNIFLCGKSTLTNDANSIRKIDPAGNALWSVNYPILPDSTLWYCNIVEREDHALAMIGTRYTGVNRIFSFCVVDTLGNLLLHRQLPTGNLGYKAELLQAGYKTFVRTLDGGYAVGGWIQNDPNNYSAFLVKMDSAGNVLPSELSGNIFYDDNENCVREGNEPFLTPVLVTFQNAVDTFTVATRDSGYYSLALDTGIYQAGLTPPSPYWEPSSCNAPSVSLAAGTDSSISFGLKPIVYSPYITISSGVNRLRACMPSVYTAKYCNTGTAPFTGVIEIEIDTLFHVDSTSVPFLAQNGNKYFFAVPTLGVMECATLQIFGTISCDPAFMGHTICIDAHAFQDTVVNVSPLWDGSNLQLMVAQAQSDSVTFTLKNIGTGGMGNPKGLMVIEDNVILMSLPVQLASGAEIIKKVPANGSTWRATIQQTDFNPYSAFATAAIEAAGVNQQGAVSLGFYLDYPINGYYGYHYTTCGEVNNSYDPNEKVVTPQGAGPDRLVDNNTELEYTIYFQNTGNDTAYLIRVTDTLVDYLNPATLVAGASSHPYQMELNGRALQFTFYNINLPDSGANQLGSNGFVKFKIKQKPGNANGTVINNKVAIYFDYNPPVVTNNATVRIGQVLLTDVQSIAKDYEVTVKAYPNPFMESARIEVLGSSFSSLQFSLYDINGRLVKQQVTNNGNSFTINKAGLNSGTYFFEISENGKQIARGKLLAQ